jgi:hypothetical protein
LDKVSTFDDSCAQLAQLASHGSNAVGFFDAPAGNIAQCGGALGVQGHYGQRHSSVGDMVAIQVNRFERPRISANI